MLNIYNVRKYDEKLFTNLFDVTYKIEIRKICIQLYESLISEDIRNICAKIYKKIRNLETQNIISSVVSCFIKLFFTKLLVFV